MIQTYKISQLGRQHKVSPHFQLGEFASKCGSDTVKIDDNLIAALEVIRRVVQRPVHINSGYRSPEHNKRIGGAQHSQHVKGRAADITVQGFTPYHLLKIAQDISLIGGLGLYNSFLHCDTRDRKPDGSQYYWTG